MGYTTLLFDLDDTILDFAASEEAALEHTYSTFFAELCAKSAFKTTFRHINRALWDLVEEGKKLPQDVKRERFEQLISELALSLEPSSVAAYYESALGEVVIWLPGAKECLESFHATHRLGVVTNGLSSVQEKKYRLSGIHLWCSCLVISESVGIAKPDPRIFEMALKQLKALPHETLMVGDSVASDYVGAMRSGIDFCWVNATGRILPEGLRAPKYEISSLGELAGVLGLLKK